MNAPMFHRPRLSVLLDGTALDARLTAALLDVELCQCLGAPAVLDLSFADADPEALSVLRPGVALTLATDGGETLFTGTISQIAEESDAGRLSLFRVTARDALHKLALRQSMIGLEDASVGDLAQQFAGEIGLSLTSAESLPKRKVILQHEQTDLDLLCDLGAEVGIYPIQRGQDLHLLTLAGDGGAELPLVFGQNLLSLHARLGRDSWLPDVRLIGRDSATLKPREAKLSLARLDQQVEMRDPGGTGDTTTRQMLNRMSASDGEAQAYVQAAIDRAAADVAVAEGLAEGDPALQPGRIIRVERANAAFQAAYVVTRTLHRMNASEGYVTEFSTEKPVRPARLRHPLTTIAEVTDVDDPENMGRAEVKLTDFGGLNAGWMQVVIAGAGVRKGVAALPDVGDEVLVLMPEGDPAHGVILGSVYGTRRLPKGAEDEPRGITIRSKDGQMLDLKGSGGVATLQNRSGSLLDIRPGRMRIAAASDLLIEAPGKVITIRASEIKFERG
jgi:phage protein D/phage baseplate assembly protein gpV